MGRTRRYKAADDREVVNERHFSVAYETETMKHHTHGCGDMGSYRWCRGCENKLRRKDPAKYKAYEKALYAQKDRYDDMMGWQHRSIVMRRRNFLRLRARVRMVLRIRPNFLSL